MEMLLRSRRLSSWLTIVAASLGILVSPLLAKGTLDIVATFQQPNLQLDLATYADGEAKIGLLGMKAAITETGTDDPVHLVVSAGPGIRFALNSPTKAGLTYVLATGDTPRFQQGLARVTGVLAAH